MIRLPLQFSWPQNVFVGCVAALILMGMPAPHAHAQAPAPGGDLDAALAEIEQTMAEWDEHRVQTIRVKAISGLEAAAASGSMAQFQERLKSLLTKKRSNREWKGYWEGEATLAGRLLSAYEGMAPTDGEGPIDAKVAELGLAQEADARTRRTEMLRVQGMEDAGDAARDGLAKVLASTQDQLPELDAAVVAGKAALNDATEPIATLEAALAKADAEAAGREGVDAKGADAARAALAKGVVARDAAAATVQTARDAQTEGTALVAYLDPLLKGEAPAGALPKADAATRGRIETLLRLDKELADARLNLATVIAAEKTATEIYEAVETQSTGFRRRRPALLAWVALARDKMSNQDIYLTAINADIEAVEERLRGMTNMPAGASIGTSAKICDAERRAEQAPLEHHRECARVTKEELRDLAALVDDVKAADALNAHEAESVNTLLKAQDTDLALVVREVLISGDEDARATAGAEAERWRAIWTLYAERSRTKKKKLAVALQTTKDTARTINVNRAFFASEQESLQQRIGQLEVKLTKRDGTARYFWALAESIWSFILNAYMVPIYLLLAWLVLRLARRAEKHLVESAKRKVDGRDEEQRVDTLASVSHSVVTLVVYIATGLLCLEAMGIDTGPILGGAAIFGLAISFGSQSLVKDFVTGFFILLENQYAVGDYVELGGSGGTVEAITMRRTVLRDMAGKVHTVPNGTISNVINHTQGWSRVVMHLGVAYGSDLDKIETIINQLGDTLFAEAEWAKKLEEPPRYIGLTKFNDSDLTVRVMFKTQIFEQWAAEREFNRRVKDVFEAEGIEIPFPQRDIHLITAAPDTGLLETS